MALLEVPFDDELASTLAGCAQHLLEPDRASRWRAMLVERRAPARLDVGELLSEGRRHRGVDFVEFRNAIEFGNAVDRASGASGVGLWWKSQARVTGIRADALALLEACTTRRADRWLVLPGESLAFVTTHEGDLALLDWGHPGGRPQAA